MNQYIKRAIHLEGRLTRDLMPVIAAEDNLDEMMLLAKQLSESAHGNIISYSKKIFIPLTMLCRDVCHYCTFAKPPVKGQKAYLSSEQVLEIARAGEKAGCKEALFTLGDKPELRYKVAKQELNSMGYDSTLDYLHDMSKLVLENTSLLPHLNPGVMDLKQIEKLRNVFLQIMALQR